MAPPVSFTDEIVCEVELSSTFLTDLNEAGVKVHDDCLAKIDLLQKTGASLPRPHAGKLDTSGSDLVGVDTRELRWYTDRNPWRAVYTFVDKKVVMLTLGCKGGDRNEKKFYRDEFRRARKALDEWRDSTQAE